ncbi:four-carbon acid sugar kinase family protein [Nocardioides sp. NPDC051685]|uniref:four-carbon acid sugar kinase family protein n=1 Tax=Nocardioides sp. NPDC051685 TaxID=3364334 RepID=UPI0037B32671
MPQIGFLADDLTGAGDVLAQAHALGLDAALVLDPERVSSTTGDVVGIAGPARSLAGEELDGAIRAGLAQLAGLDLTVLLYKVCSTFDSSPTIGSIGRAIELMHERFPGHGPIPVVPAQPDFGRYTAFSHHFGVHHGLIHRLDRHPVMSHHPATPMREADLRLVLASQLAGRPAIPGLHLPAYSDGSFSAQWKQLRAGGDEAFVVDAVDEAHMDAVAAALCEDRTPTRTPLVVGSGGIMAALARRSGEPRRPEAPSAASGPTLVVSASASATTDAQIADAVSHGWVEIAIPPEAITSEAAASESLRAVEAALGDGHDVIAHTTRGPADPRLRAAPVSSAQVGRTLGSLVRSAVRRDLTRDVVICGGDTSSHTLLALGVSELRVAEQFVTAGPICATDAHSELAGCRLLLKGGQVGPPDLFRRFARRTDTKSHHSLPERTNQR